MKYISFASNSYNCLQANRAVNTAPQTWRFFHFLALHDNHTARQRNKPQIVVRSMRPCKRSATEQEQFNQKKAITDLVNHRKAFPV